LPRFQRTSLGQLRFPNTLCFQMDTIYRRYTIIEKANRKRPYSYSFRVSEEERKIIDDKVEASKMTRTEFIIRALEKQPVTVIPNAPELLTELKRQGNNLNQAVRNYYFYKGTSEEILSCVDKLKEVYKAILSAIGGR